MMTEAESVVVAPPDISSLKQEILEDARKKSELILNEAREHADAIKKQIEEEITHILQRARDEAESLKQTEIRRQRAMAIIENKMKRLNEQERMINAIFDEALKRIDDLRGKPEYKEFLLKLAVQAGSALGGGSLVVELSEDDKKMFDAQAAAAKISQVTGSQTTIEVKTKKFSLTHKGGLIVYKGDIFVDNTINSIFDRRRVKIRQKIARKLFE